MDNIYPIDIKKVLIKSSERIHIPYLKRKALDTCRNLISEKYISSAFNRFKRGFLFKNNKENIIGFCLWKEITKIYKNNISEKILFIILICADNTDYRLGRKILFDIETYCIENKIGIISLEAANDSLIKYYEEGGFKLINKRNNEMEKIINIIPIIRTNKTRKIKRSV